jgi:hypothetical protein
MYTLFNGSFIVVLMCYTQDMCITFIPFMIRHSVSCTCPKENFLIFIFILFSIWIGWLLQYGIQQNLLSVCMGDIRSHISNTVQLCIYHPQTNIVNSEIMYTKCRFRVHFHFLFSFFTSTVMEICQGCEQDQTRQGCRIQNGVCLCGIGCYSEYRYTTKEECRKALRGYY